MSNVIWKNVKIVDESTKVKNKTENFETEYPKEMKQSDFQSYLESSS